MRRFLLVLLLLLPVGCAKFAAAACGGPDDPGAGQEIVVPSKIAGLDVKLDKKATKSLNAASDPDKTYQCPGSGRVYSMRKAKELRAVLQITRLAPDARLDDIDFVRGLVKGPTGNVLESIEINCTDVHIATSSGNEQVVRMWFTERFMFFLTVREGATLPGQVVGVNFDDVLAQSVLLVPRGIEPPDPEACPDPVSTLLPTTTPTTVPSGTATTPTGTGSPTAGSTGVPTSSPVTTPATTPAGTPSVVATPSS